MIVCIYTYICIQIHMYLYTYICIYIPMYLYIFYIYLSIYLSIPWTRPRRNYYATNPKPEPGNPETPTSNPLHGYLSHTK